MKISELQSELEKLKETSIEFFTVQPLDQLKKPLATGKWSRLQHFDHLIKSSFAIAGALKQPPEFFEQFTPNRPAESYDSLYNTYKKSLSRGIKAPPRYEASTEELNLPELLETWRMMIGKIQTRLNEKWTEETLDSNHLIHPAIGVISMRELMYSKIFHCYHHFDQMK